MKQRPVQTARYLSTRFVALAMVVVCLLGTAWLVQFTRTSLGTIEQVEADYLQLNRDLLKSHVDQAVAFIDFKRSQTEDRVRETLQNRVLQAYGVASNVYHTHGANHRSDEVQGSVREALRPLRFDTGRGYVFAMDLDGVVQLFPGQAHREGQCELDVADTNGVLVNREIISLVSSQGEGFVSYTWTKPGVDGRHHQKLSYVRLLEPLNWIIGSGEYAEDMERHIQSETVEWLETIRFGNEGYVFASDWEGVSLSGPARGRNMLHVVDANGVRIVEELIRLSRSGDGYLTYVMPPLDGKRSARKMSYVRGIGDWAWYVGAGVYLDEVKASAQAEKQRLRHAMLYSLAAIVTSLIVALGMSGWLSRRISLRFSSQFAIFDRFFEKAAHEDARIEEESLRFRELRHLAGEANVMSARRREAEAGVRESEDRLRTILDSLGSGVIIVDPDTHRVDYVNPAAAEMIGRVREEICGLRCHEIICPGEDDRCPITDLGRDLDSSEREVLAADGSRIPVLKTVSSVVLGGRNRILESFIDLRHLRQAEAERASLEGQLRQAQKMEAIGQLAGGVAHDFNNLLQVINGCTELALDDIASDDPAHEQLAEVAQAGKRAARLVQQLLTFSRRQVMQPESLDLNDVAGSLMKMIGRVIGEHIQVDFSPGHNLDRVFADRGMVEQSLMNLCLNSRDAMPDGGVLTIMIENARFDEARCLADPWADPGRYVLMRVQDTGGGMAPETVEHVFEPFFTTKEPGKGTGLGLATVYGIVKQHDGLIHAVSRPGSGTAMSVYFPASDQPAEVSEAGPAPTVVVRGSETILLAEDDAMVQSLAKRVLDGAGYTTFVVSDGREALRLFESHAADIDLVLLDVVMPEMSGPDAYEKMREMRPDVKVLFCSGYSETVVEEGYFSVEGHELLQKPYGTKLLLQRVRDLLDESGT
ncbi:MAG: response regulator [bacterium]|nr:response regulator [bacterium]